MPDTLDITPSPRVLRMLGQIDFAPWQCLAELIDNSIDAFLDGQRDGFASVSPKISIQVPSIQNLDAGVGWLSITDNARGMTLEQLQNAVRAGYSGNDPVDKMGLFGMGFNISTARLGRRTEVTTTTIDSPHWIKLTIDFDALERTKTFHVPVDLIPKTSSELDRPTQGTRVLVARLEPNRARALIWGQGKARTKTRLGKLYGRVMAAHGITLSYDGDRITPWRHCVWAESRSVPTTDFGNVPAILPINVTLDPRRYCRTCWMWLADGEATCSSCGQATDVIERSRTITGWIGIQRYFDKDHYGIDLIRNGRVIEDLDKSFFTFLDAAGESLFEYPRDAIHWGGRIVGELEVDFVRVSHQKDSFDKLDPEWKFVVDAVRGHSPLQPQIADRMGLPRNTSPLAKLFAAYRKGTAGLKSLVPGDGQGNGLNTGPVRDFVERFYAGDADFQGDERWFELVAQAERALRGGSRGARSAGGPIPIAQPAPAPPTGAPLQQPAQASDAPARTEASVDPDLSQTYDLPSLPGSPSISVMAYRHEGQPTGQAFTIMPDRMRVRIDYYPRASFFEESLVTPLDCLLIDLAQHFLVVAAASIRDTPISWIAHELRRRYFPHTLADSSTAAEAAASILNGLRSFYDEHLPAVAPIEPSSLPVGLVTQVRTRGFQADALNEEQVHAALKSGQFARYLDNQQLADLVARWPELATDGKYFTLPYTALADGLRPDSVAVLLQALADLRWLCDEGGAAVSKDAAWRLRFARALASLRLLESWAV